ncbi:MAG: TonB-dependent receptor, partial [Thermoanaerobaculia bacterium]|nr:TonB-dependent receptor [Thermoanaerobaculia bacterium]
RLSVGVDAQLEEAENRSTLLLPPFLGGAVAGDYRLERLLPGALVEVVVERGAVTWEAGGRLDAPEGAGLQFNPRLGVSRRLAGGRTRVRASAGRAFKLPSTFALASPAALGGNPDLVAESALGGDLGVQHRFGNGVEAELGVFLQRYTDLIDFDFGRFTHLNRSRVETRGVEGALAWRPSGRWSITAALTWQEVENRDTGGGLRQRPEWSGAAAVGWRPLAALRLALDVTGVSDRLDSQIPVPARERVGGYAVAGLTATWRPEGAWSIRARVENLADREHETFIGFPGAGRGARIRVRWRSR